MDEIPDVSVPHKTIPTNMNPLFEIPPFIISKQMYAIMNSLNHLTLHELYQEEMDT